MCLSIEILFYPKVHYLNPKILIIFGN